MAAFESCKKNEPNTINKAYIALDIAIYCPSLLVTNDVIISAIHFAGRRLWDREVDHLLRALKRFPSCILDDETSMLRMCELSGLSMQFASHRLRSSVTFLERAFETAGDDEFMDSIDVSVLESNPHLIHLYLEKGCLGPGAFKAQKLHRTLVTGPLMLADRDFLLLYFRAGGDPTEALNVDPTIGDDKELCLAFMQGNRSKWDPPLEKWMSDKLITSREFLAQVAVFYPFVLAHVSDDIKCDCFDILLIAVAHYYRYSGPQHEGSLLRQYQKRYRVRDDQHHPGTCIIDVVGFGTKVLKLLDLHRSFTSIFLGGVMTRNHDDHDSRDPPLLSMLDLGSDHSIKMRIAEYAGVPMGHELKYLREACPDATDILVQHQATSTDGGT